MAVFNMYMWYFKDLVSSGVSEEFRNPKPGATPGLQTNINTTDDTIKYLCAWPPMQALIAPGLDRDII